MKGPQQQSDDHALESVIRALGSYKLLKYATRAKKRLLFQAVENVAGGNQPEHLYQRIHSSFPHPRYAGVNIFDFQFAVWEEFLRLMEQEDILLPEEVQEKINLIDDEVPVPS